MNNSHLIQAPVKEITGRLNNMRPNDFMTWLKENQDRLQNSEKTYYSAEQKRLQTAMELAFSIGYDAGYENGAKNLKKGVIKAYSRAAMQWADINNGEDYFNEHAEAYYKENVFTSPKNTEAPQARD